MRISRLALGLVCLGASLALAEAPPASQPVVDPKADAELKRMSETLKGAKTFSFDVHSIADQLTAAGQSIQFARNQMVLVTRPNRAWASVSGDQEKFEFFYDGRLAVLFNRVRNAYASIDAPGTLDETLDLLATKYGLTIPLADVVFSDPYKVLTEKLETAQYIGVGYVFETPCHHIACTQDAVDWQLWIDAGEHALPRKVTITYKRLAGQPRFTAFMSKWDLSAEALESRFVFRAPADAKKVPWLAPTTLPATPAGKAAAQAATP